MPVSGFLSRCFRISVIASIALTAALYQGKIASLITKMSYDLSAALIQNPLDEAYLIRLLDQARDNEFKYASRLFEKTIFFRTNKLL